MQIVHDFLQVFLRFVYALNVRELDAVGGFDIDLGAGLAEIKHHGIGATRFFHQLIGKKLPQSEEDGNGNHPGKDKAGDRRRFLNDLSGKVCTGVVEPFRQARIVHQTCFIDHRIFLQCKDDLIVLDLDPVDLLLLGILHKRAVVYLLHPGAVNAGHDQQVEYKDQQQCDPVIKKQWFFRFLDLIHMIHLSLFRILSWKLDKRVSLQMSQSLPIYSWANFHVSMFIIDLFVRYPKAHHDEPPQTAIFTFYYKSGLPIISAGPSFLDILRYGQGLMHSRIILFIPVAYPWHQLA